MKFSLFEIVLMIVVAGIISWAGIRFFSKRFF